MDQGFVRFEVCLQYWTLKFIFEISDLLCDKTNELVTHFANDIVYNSAYFISGDLGRYSHGERDWLMLDSVTSHHQPVKMCTTMRFQS